MKNAADEWLKPAEIAAMLKISLSEAYEVVHKLPHVKTGKKYGYRVRRAVFDAWTSGQDGYKPTPLKLVKGGKAE